MTNDQYPTNQQPVKPSEPPRKLRAIVEIVDGELKIFPIAETDSQAEEIFQRLFYWQKDD